MTNGNKVTFCDACWTVEFVKEKEILDGNTACLGITDPTKKVIKICKDLEGRTLFHTVLHEFMHAAFPYLEESAITDGASEITAALEAMGYDFES